MYVLYKSCKKDLFLQNVKVITKSGSMQFVKKIFMFLIFLGY